MITTAPARPGDWYDTNTPLTPAVCAALVAAGAQGVMRYAPLPRNSPAADISAPELEVIIDAELQCLLVQHPRAVNNLSLASGAEDGMTATAHASSIGYPEGAHLYLDLEGVVSSSASQVALYTNGWSRQAVVAGFRAGLYVGYSAILSPDQLYALARFNSYWSDAGNRHISTRGCAIYQHASPVVIGGVKFDRNTVAPDLLGELPIAASPG